MANTVSTLSGLFKEVYGDDIVNLLPEVAIITKDVPFLAKEKQLGNLYHQPVMVREENGVTYAGPSAGAFTLNSEINAVMQDAQVAGAQMLLRSAYDYESAARAASSKNAFKDITAIRTMNMIDSLTKRLELSILYGQSATGLGAATAASTNQSATSTRFTVPAASWAAGIWAGSEGAQIDVFRTSNDAKLNTIGACTISAVDPVNRFITITAAAGDITAIDAITGVYFRYFNAVVSSTQNEMAGLDKIIANTGTLFNIDAATYNLWRGNSYAVGGAISFSALNQAVAAAVSRGGLLGEDVKVYINPLKWAVLNSDAAAQRMFDSSYSSAKSEKGSKSITFYGVHGGAMEIVAHPFVKESEGYMLPVKRIKRLGATDLTFNVQGATGGTDQIFTQLASQAGVEYRLYTNQAILCETPAKLVKLTGIS